MREREREPGGSSAEHDQRESGGSGGVTDAARDTVHAPVAAPLPEHLARLWGVRAAEGSALGRPATLSTEQVVRTAVALADAGGLGAATLPKVAAALGVTTMSLYRHVGTRDELIELMTDYAGNPAPVINTAEDDWRGGLRAWGRAFYALLLRRPWLTHIPYHRPPAGPHSIGWMDAALRAMRGLRLPSGDKLRFVMLLTGYLHQSARMATDLQVGHGDDPEAMYAAYVVHMTLLVDPERYPDAAALFASGPFDVEPDDRFEPVFADFDLILDGIALEEARRAAAR